MAFDKKTHTQKVKKIESALNKKKETRKDLFVKEKQNILKRNKNLTSNRTSLINNKHKEIKKELAKVKQSKFSRLKSNFIHHQTPYHHLIRSVGRLVSPEHKQNLNKKAHYTTINLGFQA